jgi:hypothetical protein
MTVIGEDRSERLDVIPAQFRVIVTKRPKLACRSCTGSVQMGLPTNGQLKNWRGGKPADGCVRDPECTFDT